jgi:hypothetical protein
MNETLVIAALDGESLSYRWYAHAGEPVRRGSAHELAAALGAARVVTVLLGSASCISGVKNVKVYYFYPTTIRFLP